MSRRPTLPTGLYAIVDDSAAAPPLELVSAFLRAGARVVQLRAKRTPAGPLLALARAARDLCGRAGALFIVNDRPDVAALAGADGVHLGQEDLPVSEARAVVGPGALVGLSTHSGEELEAALAAGADYVGFGPIFATGTKQATDPGSAPLPAPHGAVGLAHAVARARATPVVAIGGITAQNVHEVAGAGAWCAAAIGAICNAPDPEGAARELAHAYYAGLAAREQVLRAAAFAARGGRDGRS